MNVSGSAVKKTARTALAGNYFKAAVVSSMLVFTWLVLTTCFRTLGAVAGGAVALAFFAAVFVLLFCPLIMGFAYFSVRMIFGSDCEPVTAFKYFSCAKDYSKAVRLSLILSGNALFIGIFLFLPSVICSLISSGEFFKMLGMQIPSWASLFGVLSYILRVAALALLLTVMFKFYLAPFLIAANENLNVSEAMQISKIIARVTRKDFIMLILSFIGYIIACVFVIPTIFVFPYFASAYAVHCRYAVADYNKTADFLNAAPNFEADISF